MRKCRRGRRFVILLLLLELRVSRLEDVAMRRYSRDAERIAPATNQHPYVRPRGGFAVPVYSQSRVVDAKMSVPLRAKAVRIANFSALRRSVRSPVHHRKGSLQSPSGGRPARL